MKFLTFLSNKGVITPESEGAVEQLVASENITEDDALIKNGLDEDYLLELKSEYYAVPLKKIADTAFAGDILKYVSEDSASQYKFVPIGIKDGVLEVGVVDPSNFESMDAIQFISSQLGLPFKIFLISNSDFENVLKAYTGVEKEIGKGETGSVAAGKKPAAAMQGGARSSVLSKEAGEAFSEFEMGKEEDQKKAKGINEPEAGDASKKDKVIVEDAPVTKMVAVILRHAIEGNASDIHIENMGEKIRVRFRVDGTLHTSLLLPSSVHSAVISRIKILANLKLDEKRKPQDGRFSAKIDGRKIDFRVSTMPAYFGEKVVMRILDSEKGVLSLTSLGMNDKDLALVRDAINHPFGMILNTGPTGSGKSTTLYAMLNELDRDTANVISLEDPVEYSMPGVNQSQVQPEIGYTFASGLRSILRQDPDVIMVGEIRDKETASLAVQAALTGHLVFSTLHTNTSTGAVTRLIDMGVDPYLIAPTLLLVIGQRLTAKLCPEARQEVPVTDAMRMIIDKQFADLPEKYRSGIVVLDHVYEAGQSEKCPTGTKGRMAVFELFNIDAEMQEIILKKPIETVIKKAAREKGMISMREDAMFKAFEGKIPFVEVNKL